MMTATQTRETNAVFTLQSENGTGSSITTRRLSLPGAPASDGEQEALTAAFASFRQMVLNEQPNLIQPANWRDSTGSEVEAADSTEPYRTINIGLEYVITDKVAWDGSDFDPETLTITPSTVAATTFDGDSDNPVQVDFVCTTSIEAPTTWHATGHAPVTPLNFVERRGNTATLRFSSMASVAAGELTQTFTVTATDGVKSASATVTITNAYSEGVQFNI